MDSMQEIYIIVAVDSYIVAISLISSHMARSDSDEGGRVGGDLIYVRDGRRIRAAGQAQAFMMGVRVMRTRTASTAV